MSKNRFVFLSTILTNIAVTCTLLFCMNFVSALLIHFHDRNAATAEMAKDERPKLPNYRNTKNVKEIFSEFYQMPTAFVSFVEWRRLPFRGKTVTLDADGFRLHHSRLPKDPIAPLVGFFGGSTMWGTGVDDDGTIPAIFESLSSDYRAFNFAESGYNSRQNLEGFINELHKGTHLRTAVFLDGTNDVITTCRRGASINTQDQEANFRSRLTDIKPSPFMELVQPTYSLITKWMLRRAAPMAAQGNNVYDCDSNPQKAESTARILVDNWKFAKLIADQAKVSFLAVLQPVSAIGAPNLSHLKLEDHTAAQYRAVYPRIKRILAAEHLDWAKDYTDAFDGNEYFYIDFCHVSQNGNAVLAKRIRKDLGKASAGAQAR